MGVLFFIRYRNLRKPSWQPPAFIFGEPQHLPSSEHLQGCMIMHTCCRATVAKPFCISQGRFGLSCTSSWGFHLGWSGRTGALRSRRYGSRFASTLAREFPARPVVDTPFADELLAPLHGCLAACVLDMPLIVVLVGGFCAAAADPLWHPAPVEPRLEPALLHLSQPGGRLCGRPGCAQLQACLVLLQWCRLAAQCDSEVCGVTVPKFPYDAECIQTVQHWNNANACGCSTYVLMQ